MGTHITEIRYDDYTGEPDEDIREFPIIIDGVKYTLDASPSTRDQIRRALQPWTKVAHATEVDGSGDDPQVIREWARKHGYSVTNHGRVPLKVVAAYHEAIR